MATITQIQATDIVKDSRVTINNNFTALNEDKIDIDGSVAMEGDLSLGGNQITNLGTPTNDTDAANKSYVDTEISEIVTASYVYNVKDYGALGNGTTDDTSAIQDALDACVSAGGGAVYIPSGLYVVSNQLTATNVPIKIYGDGINVTKLRWTSTATAYGISISTDEDIKTVTIQGLTLFTLGNTGTAIYLNFDDQDSSGTLVDRSTPRFLIQDVHCTGYNNVIQQGWHTGVEVSSPMVGNIVNFHMQGRVTAGTPMVNESVYGIYVHAMNNTFDNGHPVEVICDKCSIYNVQKAIWFQYIEGGFAYNCNLVGVNYGVSFNDNYGRPQLNVANCHINAYTVGIYAYNCNEVTAIGNLIYRVIDANTATSGINLHGSTGIGSNYFVCIGNTFEDTAAGSSNFNGIVADRATYGVISNNVFRKTQTSIWLTANSANIKGAQNVYATSGTNVLNSGTSNSVT